MFVHPPEDGRSDCPPGDTALYILRDQINQYVYPVHRLDRPTSGILIFALSPQRAAWFQRQFQNQSIKKVYAAVTRGWMTEELVCNEALNDYRSADAPQVEALTLIRPIATATIQSPIGKFPEGRISLVSAEPRTGRFHQIRRHLQHLNHPIVGDSTHGDLKFNRYIETELNWSGLRLRAVRMEIPGDENEEKSHIIEADWPESWQLVLQYFGLPLDYKAQ